MRIRLCGMWWLIAALAFCTAAVAQEDETPAEVEELASDLQACPPPDGASSEDVVVHVLAEQIGSWWRQNLLGGDISLTPELIARFEPEVREMLSTYHASHGAATTYHNSAGPGTADVVMIAFNNPLDALGFFAAQRSASARQVLLGAAAYRDEKVLHVSGCAFYFRVEVHEAQEGPLPADQYLASRLAVRLPQRENLPYIMQLMPRGWVTPLTVSYDPTDLLGEELSPMAAGAAREVGYADVRLRIIEAEDEVQARRWYTAMLQQALDRGQAWEIVSLGEDAFFSTNSGTAVGMLQDRFIAHVTTDGSREDAVAIMRLVGTQVRVTRPLPDAPEGYCPPLDSVTAPNSS